LVKLRRGRGPVASSVAERAQARARGSAAYRAAAQRTAPYEQVAGVVIGRRGELGLTQQELAGRIGTSQAAISRIERGQYGPSGRILARLAATLEIDSETAFQHSPGELLRVRRRCLPANRCGSGVRVSRLANSLRASCARTSAVCAAWMERASLSRANDLLGNKESPAKKALIKGWGAQTPLTTAALKFSKWSATTIQTRRTSLANVAARAWRP
jgi:transcriptional regulator with XRE-family HTH domain